MAAATRLKVSTPGEASCGYAAVADRRKRRILTQESVDPANIALRISGLLLVERRQGRSSGQTPLFGETSPGAPDERQQYDSSQQTEPSVRSMRRPILEGEEREQGGRKGSADCSSLVEVDDVLRDPMPSP